MIAVVTLLIISDNLKIFMYSLIVTSKISLCSGFMAAMFERGLDSFMHYLLVTRKWFLTTNYLVCICNVCKDVSLFHVLPSGDA